MKQDYILINGIKYTHILKEDIYENLNNFPSNALFVLSQSSIICQKNSLLQETTDEFIDTNGTVFPKDLNINISPLKFKQNLKWDMYYDSRFITLGQYLIVHIKKNINNGFDIRINTTGTSRNSRTIIEFKDYLLDDENTLVQTIFGRKILKDI